MGLNNLSPFQDDDSPWPFTMSYSQGGHLPALTTQGYQNNLPLPMHANSQQQWYHRDNGNAPGIGTITAPVSLTDINHVIKPSSAEPWQPFEYQGDFNTPRARGTSFSAYPATTIGPARAIFQSPSPIAEPHSKAASDSGYQSGYPPSAGANTQLRPSASPSANRGQPRQPRSLASQPAHRGRVAKQAPKRRRRAATESGEIVCQVEKNGKKCNRVLKNNSEAKKHKSAHEKPFACTETRCMAVDKRFGTLNDLDRHCVGVHDMESIFKKKQGGYICAACQQDKSSESNGKWWPRQDNFKAHFERKHEEEWDFDDLLEQSWREKRPANAPSESGRASVSRVDQGDAAPSEFDFNNLRFSPSESMASGQRPSVPGFHPHYPGGAGNNGDFLAHIGTGPSAEPFGRNLSGNNLDFQNVFESDLSRVETYGGGGYGFMDVDASAGNTVTSNPQQYGTQCDFDSDLQYALPYPQTHFNESLYVDPTPNNGGSTPDACAVGDGEWTCEHCGKKKQRECDLRKHLKRHTRPYGCTFPHCGKRLGSRNDWKRHEIKQHFLLEMWRCMLPRPDGETCGKLCHDLTDFTNHLAQHHDLVRFASPSADHANDPTVRSMHLGRQGHEHFWCGFCNQLIRQPGPDDDNDDVHGDGGPDFNAWETRFQHIGDHFDKGGCNIGDWICIERNQPLRSLPFDKGSSSSMASSRRNSKGKDGAAGRGSGVTSASASFGQKVEEDSDLGDDGIPELKGKGQTRGPS